MDIVRTSIGIGRTIRNVARLREILSVFAKNGFDELILKLKMTDIVPNFVLPQKKNSSIDLSARGDNFWSAIGFRLIQSFEELGPSFIKLGQVLATREDLFPEEFISQMKKMHGDTKAMPFDQVKEIIERNLGKKIEEVFDSIQETPLGTASIGGVYKATLKDGCEVVIKVRKPGLKKMIQGDFEILDWIVGQLEKVSEDVKTLGLKRMLAEFGKSLHHELNFFQEAMNAKKMKEGLKKLPEAKFIIVPDIYDEYTGEDILVMDFLDGRPFSSLKHIDEMGTDGIEKIQICVRSFIYSLLRDGFFHADLHGGNFFFLNDGNVGLIDFGLMGRLSQKNRVSLIVILSSMLQEDFERLVSEFLDISDFERMPDERLLVRDIRDALAPYLGLSVQQTDIQALFTGVFDVLTQHRVMLPTEWFLIFRSIVMLDGIGQSLKIDINFHELIMEDISSMAGDILSLDKLKKEAMWLGRDALDAARILPRHIRWFARHLEKRDYMLELEVKGIEPGFKSMASALEFLAFMIVGATFSVLSVITFMSLDISHISQVPLWFWGLVISSLVFFLGGFKRLPRN